MIDPSRNRLRASVTSVVLLALVAGAAAGVVGTKLLTPRVRLRSSLDDMSAVLDRLRLTPEQRRQADAIVANSAPRSREVLLELGTRLKSVADSVDAELRLILTPGQRLTLDSLRTDSRLLLKRRTMTPTGPKVDTLFDTSAVRRSRPQRRSGS